MKIGQKRRRSIHVSDTNQDYTWIPFEHCVCVWNRVFRNNSKFMVDAELPVQFARHNNEPVRLSDIAYFIKRVLLVDNPPAPEGFITLLCQEPIPMRKHCWSPIDVIGSFEDEILAEQEANQRTAKSNVLVYRALTLGIYSTPA